MLEISLVLAPDVMDNVVLMYLFFTPYNYVDVWVGK